jgi:hypothetical protein
LARRVDGIFLSFEQDEIGPDLFRHACLLGLEGLVCKHCESNYRGGRFRHWIKVKNRSARHPAPRVYGAVMLAVTVSIEAALLFRLRSVLDQLINELFRMADSVFTAKGSSYLFLVITHAPSPDRWEKCLNNRRHDAP